MNDSLRGTLIGTGSSCGVTGTTATTTEYPETLTNSGASIANGTGKTSLDSSESGLGKETTGGIVISALAGAFTSAPVVYEVRTKNNIDYDVIEKRANKIYDRYNKNHVPSDKRGKGIIIADNPDTAEICHRMFNTTFVNKEHLILNIISLLLALEEIVNNNNLLPQAKAKLEETINLLNDIKAAYTEKKIIKLSTEHNETLLFILNNFESHQQEKKDNTKKLIKERKNNNE